VCWHVRLPTVIRLACGLYDELTSDPRGIHVVDDSHGLGPLTWKTQ
jgi:hypothetical protein